MSQTVPDNVLSVPICRVHDADRVADRVANHRRSLQIIWEAGLSVSICWGHDADWLPIEITDRRRRLQIIYENQALGTLRDDGRRRR
mgnify:CR=1 FL=1